MTVKVREHECVFTCRYCKQLANEDGTDIGKAVAEFIEKEKRMGRLTPERAAFADELLLGLGIQ